MAWCIGTWVRTPGNMVQLLYSLVQPGTACSLIRCGDMVPVLCHLDTV